MDVLTRATIRAGEAFSLCVNVLLVVPRGLPKIVKHHLEKAQDSALQAVEIYNKPAVRFRSGGYIVLMVIAWTSLFHAIVYSKKNKPWRRGDNNRFIRIDGEPVHWELSECLKRHYETDTQNPVRKNLEFFIQLRNRIEHRSMPKLDANIFGECQQMLLNFDEVMRKEFGEKYCLRESLTFSLQLFPSAESMSKAVKQSRSDERVNSFIESYRSSLSTSVLESPEYAFKAFLIRVPNHQSKDSLPVQFINFDQLSDEQKEGLSPFITMVKYKDRPVANSGSLKPSMVVKKVQEKLGDLKLSRYGKEIDKFNSGTHTLCWKKYAVRPKSDSQDPKATDTKFCFYNEPHQDYLYTPEWVDFLVGEMSDEEKYKSLYKPLSFPP